jgi:hypothetical protein
LNIKPIRFILFEKHQFSMFELKPVTCVKAIKKEVIRCIKLALRDKHLIRIKYKNRHGELCIRTLKDFEVIKSTKTKLSKYVIDYSFLCKEERTFKISHIQHLKSYYMIS